MELKSNLSFLFLFGCLICLTASIKYEHINFCYFNIFDVLITKSVEFTFLCYAFDREGQVFKNSKKINTVTWKKSKMKEREYDPGVVDKIQFRKCRFPTLKRNFFEMFYNLQTFSISSVELETLQVNMFREAKNLTELDISKNRLKEIPSHIFMDSVKLKDVDFSNNYIIRIDPLAFEGAIQLQKLNLSFNQITDLDSRTFNLPNLLILDLSNNNITKYNENIFEKLTNLTTLNLSFNALEHLHIGTFGGLFKLKELSLRHTNLSDIQPGTFFDQNFLLSLDLSENNIKRIDFKSFASILLLNLQSLRLGGNQLTDLNGFHNALFPQMDLLDIQGNPFNCSYLLHFMESDSRWKRIHFHSTATGTDVHKTYIQGVKCDLTPDGKTTHN